jgi:hypothetical protein
MKIPSLNSKPFYNSDSVAESISTDDMMDCYLEAVPGEGFITRRRPGMTQFCDLGTSFPGDGIYDWESADKVIAVSGGRIFSIYEDGTFSELIGLGENESPVYSGDNHEQWNLGTGWQVPVKNESDDEPPIAYSTYFSELDLVWNGSEYVETTVYPFENGALAKISDGTGQVTPVKANTTLKGVDYTVVIKSYVTVGTFDYTLGGTSGTQISTTTTTTDTVTTISQEGLVITPSNTARGVLTFSWKANSASRDYPISGTPVIFDDGQDTAGNPWLYLASGRLTYLKDET